MLLLLRRRRRPYLFRNSIKLIIKLATVSFFPPPPAIWDGVAIMGGEKGGGGWNVRPRRAPGCVFSSSADRLRPEESELAVNNFVLGPFT